MRRSGSTTNDAGSWTIRASVQSVASRADHPGARTMTEEPPSKARSMSPSALRALRKRADDEHANGNDIPLIVVLPTGCWLWTGPTGTNGYGTWWVKGDIDNGRPAHRVIYETLTGAPVPKGLELDHLCRDRSCVNPAHVEPVTHKQNCLRGKGLMARNARKTHCPRGHLLSGSNVRVYIGRRWTERICRACNAICNKRDREVARI